MKVKKRGWGKLRTDPATKITEAAEKLRKVGKPIGVHTCHAIGCETEVEPKLLMCLKHWRMVPGYLQKAICKVYVPGQEITKTPTAEYLAVARRVIEAVRQIESGEYSCLWFGKYAEVPIEDVPTDYLKYLLRPLDPNLGQARSSFPDESEVLDWVETELWNREDR